MTCITHVFRLRVCVCIPSVHKQGNDGEEEAAPGAATAQGPAGGGAGGPGGGPSPRRPTQHRLSSPRVPLGVAPRARAPTLHRVSLMRAMPSAELLQTTRLQWEAENEEDGKVTPAPPPSAGE